ncbi:MAG: diaminopimelate epimerase, partial [Desulfobulbaceae bacterium]|nr:diaminopimelate epimerase [Desulfobulbaceae bacterium]
SAGADGMIFIEESDKADFKWLFFNGDGSEAEMCGNGARCAARFAYMQGIAPAHMHFETVAGIIEAKVSDINVSVLMTEPKDFRIDRNIELEGRVRHLHSVDTGVPHAVLFVENFDGVDIRETGRMIRFHKDFMPAGTNVNFVQPLEDGSLKVRTYERGVEDETMACGTGAVAAALIAAVRGMASSPVDITTSGGDRLTILFDLHDGPAASNVFLKGPAHVVYYGELNAEALIEN